MTTAASNAQTSTGSGTSKHDADKALFCWFPGWNFSADVFAPLMSQLEGVHYPVNYLPLTNSHQTLEQRAAQLADDIERHAQQHHCTAIVLIGWSLGGAVALHCAAALQSVSKRPVALLTLATGKRFVKHDSTPSQGMPSETLAAFRAGFATNQKKTQQRFLGLCTQGADAPRALMRQLAASQLTQESQALAQSLDWLSYDELPNVAVVQQHWYSDNDALKPQPLSPSYQVSQGGHCFFLNDTAQMTLVSAIREILLCCRTWPCDKTLQDKSEHNPPQRNKQQVARQFSRAAHSYDQAASIQQQAINHLMQQMPDPLDGHWLDIGCGTGAAFAPLLERGVTHISGVDLAEGMLQFIEQRLTSHPRQHAIETVLADADALPFNDNSRDGIFSSLMLQWSENPQRTLSEWQRVIKPGGIMAIATLLPGTQQEMIDAWQQIDQRPHVNQFATRQQLLAICEQLQLQRVSEQQQCLMEHYDSLNTLLRSLKAIGATNVNAGRKNGLGGRTALKQLNQVYPRSQTGQFPLSYQVYWLVLRKPAAAF